MGEKKKYFYVCVCTGSLLYPCAHFGAMIVGADLNKEVLKFKVFLVLIEAQVSYLVRDRLIVCSVFLFCFVLFFWVVFVTNFYHCDFWGGKKK